MCCSQDEKNSMFHFYRYLLLNYLKILGIIADTDIETDTIIAPFTYSREYLVLQIFSLQGIKGRFLEFRRCHNFANLFSKL